jgi:hypothetical protein
MDFYKKYQKYKIKYNDLKYYGGIGESIPSKPQLSINEIPTLKTLLYFDQFSIKNMVINKFEDVVVENNKTYLMNNESLTFSIENNYIFINGEKVNWVGIKNKYLFNENPNEKIMRAFFDFRTTFVDNLIKIIFKFYGCNQSNECLDAPSGSVGPQANLASDYDITINNQSFNVSHVIRSFNTIIFNTFGDQPSVVFDTNLYGYSALLPKSMLKNNINPNWVMDTTFNTHYFLPLDINKKQDKWALIRLLTFLDKEHESLINVQTKIPSHKNVSNDKMYVKRMKIFEENFKNKKINKDIIAHNLSFMNYYGDETYFTLGAFKHVVGTMFYYSVKTDEEKKSFLRNQGPIKDKSQYIMENNLIHSMIENLAYFIHILHKNNNIITAIKYLERFMDAFKLFKIIEFTDNDTKLFELMKNLKNNFRNRSNDEILTYLKSDNSVTIKNIISDIDINIDNIDKIIHKIILILGEYMVIFLNHHKIDFVIPGNLNNNDIYIYYLIYIIKSVIKNNNTHIEINYIDNKFIFRVRNKL